MENNFPEDLPLSNSPQEALRMENQLLQLKLIAELGAQANSMTGIPPDIENQFLKNVLAFEQATAQGLKQVKVYELIGKPDFKLSSQINDENIENALTDIIGLLLQKSIAIDFLGEYDSRAKYEFITLELFEYETDDTIIPGMVRHFTYEDFHPNHKLDIENRAMEFISNWFKQAINSQSWELGDQFILPDGTILNKEQVAEKLNFFFDCYTSFTDCQYFIADIGFELRESNGMGYAEGGLKYTAITQNGETLPIEGPFKLYFSMEHAWWSIMYFIFPGFEFN